MSKLGEQTKILLLGATSLLLGVLFVWLFYKEQIGLNYPLYLSVVTLLGLLLAWIFSLRLTLGHYAIIWTGLFFSAMVYVRSGELLTFYNILGSTLLFLIALRTLTGKHLRAFLTRDYLRVVILPFQFIGPFFETFSAIISLKNIPGKNARTREIVRGSIMATIALLIFGWLLASADAIFQRLLSHIFTLTIDQDLGNRVFIGTFMTAFFIGAFGFLFRRLHAATAPSPAPKDRTLGALETMILFGAINILFFFFIILQLSALFGGMAHLLQEGLTYAEYAREGFFQLVVVAILSFFVISFAETQIIQRENTHLRSFRILSGMLVAQVLAILISAFNRLSLYEEAYGFTDTRLYSHAFMIWLGVVLALLALHIWKSGKRTDFSFRVFCSLIVFLFAMNVLNPDEFIVEKNLERYRSTGLLDAKYLGSLSDDALPYTIQLLNDPNGSVRKDFAESLSRRESHCDLDNCTGPRRSTWKSARRGRSATEKLLQENRTLWSVPLVNEPIE